MQTIEGFPFFSLTFDQDGVLESRDEFGAMVERAKTAPRATDAVFLAHGFRNDVNDASRLYSTFLRNFRAHLSRTEFKDIAGRQFLAAGVYWPSTWTSPGSMPSASTARRSGRRRRTSRPASAPHSPGPRP